MKARACGHVQPALDDAAHDGEQPGPNGCRKQGPDCAYPVCRAVAARQPGTGAEPLLQTQDDQSVGGHSAACAIAVLGEILETRLGSRILPGNRGFGPIVNQKPHFGDEKCRKSGNTA